MTTRDPARGWALLGVSLCASLLLAACGGGGGGGSTDGGGGGGGGGGVTITLSADVYPLASGDRRSWRVTAGSGVGSVRHERVGEAVAGALIVRGGGNNLQQPTDDEYLQRSATGISSVPGPNSDALTRAAGAVELLRFGAAQGQSVVLYERSLSADVDGDGRADSVDLRVEAQFVGVEALTTTLTAFAEASHVRTSIRSVVRLAGTTASHTINQTVDDWYVVGIGPVRTSSSTTTDGGVADVETEDVMAYAVGSRHSESVAPTVAQALPVNDSLSRPDTELRLSFSEPIDPLSLRGDTGLKLMLNGNPLVPQALQLSADAKTLTIFTTTYPLADGRYELRNGGQVSDWAGNAAPAVLSSFRVDTTGPRLQSSSPAQGADEAPLSGTLSFTFNEPVVVPPGVELKVLIQPDSGGTAQQLPATLQGNSVVATLTTPLQPNTAYFASVGLGLTDAGGNPMGDTALRFRTDPGPFGRPQAWAGNLQIGSLAVADVDGDGRSDLVFTALVPGGAYFVGARLQSADGRYGDVRQLYVFTGSTFCGMRGLAVGDLDGDGRADIVVHGECNQQATTILRQRSDGSFSAEASPVDLSLGAIAVMDAAAGQSGVVGVTTQGLSHLRRLADGTWQQTLLAATSTFDVRDWRAADLNGDGRADLVWVQSSASGFELGWALRTATGWGAVQTRPLPASTPRALAAGDFDGDGRLDIALAMDTGVSGPASNGEVWVLRQTASGGFGDPLRMATAWAASALLVADLNGDGRADIVVSHDILWRTGVLLQSSAGAFEAERLFESAYGYFTGRRPLALLDLNGDGQKDLVQAEVLLPGRAFTGAWPLGVAAPAPAARANAVSRPLRATSQALGAGAR